MVRTWWCYVSCLEILRKNDKVWWKDEGKEGVYILPSNVRVADGGFRDLGRGPWRNFEQIWALCSVATSGVNNRIKFKWSIIELAAENRSNTRQVVGIQGMKSTSTGRSLPIMLVSGATPTIYSRLHIWRCLLPLRLQKDLQWINFVRRIPLSLSPSLSSQLHSQPLNLKTTLNYA